MTEPERPSFDSDSQDPLAPRTPWSFLAAAAPGGFSRAGLGFLASWAAFFLCSNVFWALHLKSLAGWSSLPNYWGELLTTRDLWELVENGGLKASWTGPVMPVASGLCFLWFLWAGWRVQAAAIRLQPRLAAWAWGLLDALLIGALPLLLVEVVLTATLGWLGSLGIQGLCWVDWVGTVLVRLACVSAWFLQWWLCRVNRASGPGGRLQGGWKAFGSHLWQCFLAFWLHPVQWTLVVVGGVVARTGLTFLVLVLAWRLGGGTPLRVWGFLLLQVGVVVLNAWLLGWFLRVVALFGWHHASVQAEIRRLEADARGGELGGGC